MTALYLFAAIRRHPWALPAGALMALVFFPALSLFMALLAAVFT